MINAVQRDNPHFAVNAIKHVAEEGYPVDFRFADFRTSILFLSLAYHYNSPLYVNTKLEALKKTEQYRSDTVLLAIIQDVDDTKAYLYDIQLKCLGMGVQVMLFKTGAAFSSFLRSLQTDN